MLEVLGRTTISNNVRTTRMPCEGIRMLKHEAVGNGSAVVTIGSAVVIHTPSIEVVLEPLVHTDPINGISVTLA